MEHNRRKPDWLKIKLPMGQLSTEVLNAVRGYSFEYHLYKWQVSESGGMLGMWYGDFYDWWEYCYAGVPFLIM